MANKTYPEKILKSKVAYKGGIINVEKQKVELHNGQTAERDVVHNAKAVSALVLDPQHRIILEKQWREPVRKFLWEIPAGKVDNRDHGSSLHAIKRELNEELRITPNIDLPHDGAPRIFRRVFGGYSSPGFSDEFSTMYLVVGYHDAKKDLPRDKGEYLHLAHFTYPQVIHMMHDGKIADMKSFNAIQYWSILRLIHKQLR